MNFCKECNNLLLPFEYENNLYLKCNNCGNTEVNNNPIIYKKNYKSHNLKNIPFKKWIIYDNTLARTTKQKCPNKKCKSHSNKKLQESVIYINKINKIRSYICVNCITEWKI